jgi:hypothetical protein
MSNDPQEGVPPDKWMSHDGIIWIGAMPGDLMQHIKRRNLDWRVIK